MANPYQVNVPSLYEALMAGESGYKGMRDMQSQNAMSQARREAQTALSGGGDTRSAMARLIGAGDMQGATAIANMTDAESDREWRRAEATRSQNNADRAYGLQVSTANRREIPAGFEASPSGGLRPVAGGPADPTYLGQRETATQKPRNMSVGDITKLQEEGAKFSNLTRFSETFKDDFGGQPLGNARNWVGRNLPEVMVDPRAAAGANWWQDYDRSKNLVRTELFGSALTATEQAAFEKADINPSMQPSIIKENIKRQREIVEVGLKRKAAALVNEGYRPESISRAYGIKVEDLGVAPQRQGTGQAAAPPGQIAEGRTATGPGGAKIIFRGGQWVPVQ
jgi:hypothetical protein